MAKKDKTGSQCAPGFYNSNQKVHGLFHVLGPAERFWSHRDFTLAEVLKPPGLSFFPT